jgi:hypothetical protein
MLDCLLDEGCVKQWRITHRTCLANMISFLPFPSNSTHVPPPCKQPLHQAIFSAHPESRQQDLHADPPPPQHMTMHPTPFHSTTNNIAHAHLPPKLAYSRAPPRFPHFSHSSTCTFMCAFTCLDSPHQVDTVRHYIHSYHTTKCIERSGRAQRQ